MIFREILIQTSELADHWLLSGTGHLSMLSMAPEFLRSGRLVPLIEVTPIELLITWPNGIVNDV